MTESFHEGADLTVQETADAQVEVESAAVEPPVLERPEPEPTGDADVDAVVASLAQLDDLPVAEHVAVFEQAHDSLRRTLAGAGHDGPAAGRG